MNSGEMTHTYEDAIDTLNSLDSRSIGNNDGNVRLLNRRVNKVENMRDFFIRSGMKFEELDKLSVIHVTGTKGKGSTCAYCESILRHHGVKTGFFSSPHLISVIERLQINGTPVSKDLFNSHFWEVYNNLKGDKPGYFQMLVLVALKIFMAENVDVALIEVGIGGEYDSTNILRVVPVAGITSIGFEHVATLGNTLESIAWHKSGIMKRGAKVFTVPQPPEVMNVIKERSKEKQCDLEIVEITENPYIRDCIGAPLNVLGLNASIAIKMAETWLSMSGKNIAFSMEKLKEGLQNWFWPGRYQIFRTERIDFHLDGAHTDDSLKLCLEWFKEITNDTNNKKALMFNNIGNRDSERHLGILKNCDFDMVLFVPNIGKRSKETVNIKLPETAQLDRCSKHKNIWLEAMKGNENTHQQVIVKPTIEEALETIETGSDKYDLLVTGSLYLIGATLSLIDPYLRGNNSVFNNNQNN